MRFTRHSVFILFLFLVEASASLVFAASEVSVKAEVDKAFITIGDRVSFKVTVIHGPKTKVIGLDATPALRDFEVKNVQDFSFKDGELLHEGKNYSITSYDLGEYVIWSFAVTVRTPSGDIKEVETNKLYVTVQSIGEESDSDSDIRGVKGIWNVGRAKWPWFLLGLTVLAILGLLAFMFLRKSELLLRRKSEPSLSPHDEAYQGLYRLKHSEYLKKNQFKAYFFEMSEILRRYFERRYDIPALESTTYELMRDLKAKTTSKNRTLVEEVLTFQDMVKFAKLVPSVQEVLKLNKQAIEIIDQTKEEERAQVNEAVPNKV